MMPVKICAIFTFPVILVCLLFVTNAHAQLETESRLIEINVTIIALDTVNLAELGLGTALGIDENDLVTFSPGPDGTDLLIGDLTPEGNIEVDWDSLITENAFSVMNDAVLTVVDGQQAEIFIGSYGTELATVPTESGNSFTSRVKPVINGINFSVTPTITSDNLIQMECSCIISDQVNVEDGFSEISTALVTSSEVVSSGLVANGFPFLIRNQVDNETISATSPGIETRENIASELAMEILVIVTPTIIE